MHREESGGEGGLALGRGLGLHCAAGRDSQHLLTFVIIIAQVLVFGRSLRKYLFKFVRLPSFGHFSFVLVMEVPPSPPPSLGQVLHTIGLATLAFLVLPHLDSSRALLLTTRSPYLP